MKLRKTWILLATLALPLAGLAQRASADPCGMVPPVYIGEGPPITRTGEQQTYVFYKDGVETFVIRPGFQGKVDEFGMLIPFPKPPEIRKVSDNIFAHIAAAIDPPEIVVDVGPQILFQANARNAPSNQAFGAGQAGGWKYQQVRVLRQEAVGMYEVAVLEAGSPAALKRWMDQHEYKFPKGMEKVCGEYIKEKWCFVAVKTQVGQKKGVDPKPGQRTVNSKLPTGSTFDGSVQAMGFRFKTDKLVVPMRLSSFNAGELRNVVYLLTDGPRKVRAIPEEYVVRQVSGEQLYKNVTDLLPLRIINGTAAEIPVYRRKSLPKERDPAPHNGAARDLFAADLLSARLGRLSHPHEEKEKELLKIGERFGLRGAEIDKLNEKALADHRAKIVEAALADLKGMTLTVIDGDFPREVLGGQNLAFAEYRMPSRRNRTEFYDAKLKKPAGKKAGVIKLGQLTEPVEVPAERQSNVQNIARISLTSIAIGLVALVSFVVIRRRKTATIALLAALPLAGLADQAAADPCGMVPPVYLGDGQPITRIGEQQTYVYFKDGVETFVIRPGFKGKVDEFGMLIPFPEPPAIRKVPDHIFAHLAAAVDPPEVVVDLTPRPVSKFNFSVRGAAAFGADRQQSLQFDDVRVVRQEAVGMYEVAVLEAGSPAALKRWMDDHEYKFPVGMEAACGDYIKDRWCFVAVKTKVGQKNGVDPKPGQRTVNSKLPSGSTFDGSVQAMGFRFRVKELVVPMRLSSFNPGELRNVIYLLTDGPRKVRAIPEEYVVRQVSGDQLYKNVTDLLPLRIIGGTAADIPDYRRKQLPKQRDPVPHNGAARDLFASDLLATGRDDLSLPHEEKEKELLKIGERLGLRGGEIDKLNTGSLADKRAKTVEDALAGLKDMTLTVIDGDFPREVLGQKNLAFAEYRMPSRRNSAEFYDTKVKKPAGKKAGVLKLGRLDDVRPNNRPEQRTDESIAGSPVLWTTLGFVAIIGLLAIRRRKSTILALLVALPLAGLAAPAIADPCGMVPPVYLGDGPPITRVGSQQTYVCYKDGIETFVIRPGFTGNVDEFGMLIPFPEPPAIRKVPDHIFAHIAAAIDPPEVIVDLIPRPQAASAVRRSRRTVSKSDGGALGFNQVRVVRQEAIGMYEVAVLEAGSPAALKRWLDEHKYKFPDGMEAACSDYIKEKWCFVAVKTKVGQKKGVDPQPGQRGVNAKLPAGSTFDGQVQAMGFRFKSDKLVVPMRLSSFNAGELRNIVYLLTDGPRRISAIPEEYVVRQISGEQLYKNVTEPLPVRLIGGTSIKDIPDWRMKSLATERNPEPKNGAAKELFAGDLLAIMSGKLSLPHEEKEKELLRIGEKLGLRGGQIDRLNGDALSDARSATVAASLDGLKKMTLTVIDGDFPREVLAQQNLTFAEYRMPSKRNKGELYDAKNQGPAGPHRRGSVRLSGVLRVEDDTESSVAKHQTHRNVTFALLGFSALLFGLALTRRRK
jgi:hypothetical protein